MKTRKLYCFDLNDLGTDLQIKGVRFTGANTFGVCCDIDVKINKEDIIKKLNLPRNIVTMGTDMITFTDECIDGFLFAARTSKGICDNIEFPRDGYREPFIFEVYDKNRVSGYYDPPVPGIILNDNLIRTLEAYATACFYKKLGIVIGDEWFEKQNRDSLYGEEETLYVRKYLVIHNFDLLTSREIINGKDIDYPIR